MVETLEKALILIEPQIDIDGFEGFIRKDDHSVVDFEDITLLKKPPILIYPAQVRYVDFCTCRIYRSQFENVPKEANALLLGTPIHRSNISFFGKSDYPASFCILKEVPREQREYRFSKVD